MLLQLTKRFTFEMAHALPTYPGKCHNIHGHSYKLFVTVQGTPCQQAGDAPDGMLIDFGRIKEIVNQRIVEPFDHALVLPRQVTGDSPSDTQLGSFAAKIIWVEFTPTTENLLFHFAHLLDGAFPSGTTLHSLKLYETESSCAELIL